MIRGKKKVIKSHVQCIFPAKVAVFETLKQKDSRLYISEFITQIRSQNTACESHPLCELRLSLPSPTLLNGPVCVTEIRQSLQSNKHKRNLRGRQGGRGKCPSNIFPT